jgi:hypothetical protein
MKYFVSRTRFLTRRVNKRTDRNESERCKAERIPLFNDAVLEQRLQNFD